MEEKEFYYRKMPHWLPRNGTFFLTFRLTNSLPKAVLDELIFERSRLLNDQSNLDINRGIVHWQTFEKYDAWLDDCRTDSPHWLSQPSIAEIVVNEIMALDGVKYLLLAFCVMSNHAHLLTNTTGFEQEVPSTKMSTTSPYLLTDSLRLLKGRTARSCNLALGRTGAFWQHESYDHVVRDEQEYNRVLFYIINNPVKAGLVRDWEDWKYTYVKPGLLDLDE